MRKILLPLLKPALVYAWLWMALLCYRELTMASVLVTSQDNITLPMIVWGLWLGGSLNQAAAANLVVLAFMLPAVIALSLFRPAQPLLGDVIVISITGLRKNFQSGDHAVAALQGIDLEVQRGEFFVLLGPSGSGKTTLLRSVAGLEKPDNGEISLDDKMVFSSSRRIREPPEERGIGMVFQSYAIWPHLTVAENIGLVLTHGRSRLSKNEATNADTPRA